MASNVKKISQSELRKFMSLQKRRALESDKKIESPLAKYLDNGVLTCIVCGSAVKSETVWNVHINSKQHKENIARKSQSYIAPPSVDKPVDVKQPVLNKTVTQIKPLKRPKGILKNAVPLPPKFFDDIKEETEGEGEEVPAKKVKLSVNDGENCESDGDEVECDEQDMDTEEQAEKAKDTELPEGFFDDPILDAKARNVEYKDPVEEEWERFQKEIKEATDLSSRIINDDTEDATVQRQIEEIDEQISKLSRVVQLENKKEEMKAKVLTRVDIKKEEAMDEDIDEGDIDIDFDWRAKGFLS